MKKMKKFLLVLSLALCVLGLTACGSKEEESALSFGKEEAVAIASGFLESVDQISAQSSVDELYAYYKQNSGAEEAEAIKSLLTTWTTNKEEFGDYSGIVEDATRIEGTDDDFTIYTEIKGSIRNADVEMYFVNGIEETPNIMVSPQYTLGEKMEKAALNTLLGMGTVFMVLVLIMFIIYAFGIIPKIEKSIANKKAAKAQATDTEKAVDNTIAQIIENEELSDDTELVAVIAAAIAAYEGSASTDGFVVRSIKRANTNKWQRA